MARVCRLAFETAARGLVARGVVRRFGIMEQGDGRRRVLRAYDRDASAVYHHHMVTWLVGGQLKYVHRSTLERGRKGRTVPTLCPPRAAPILGRHGGRRGSYVPGHIDGLDVVVKPRMSTGSSNSSKVVPRAAVWGGALELPRLVCGSMHGIAAIACRALLDG